MSSQLNLEAATVSNLFGCLSEKDSKPEEKLKKPRVRKPRANRVRKDQDQGEGQNNRRPEDGFPAPSDLKEKAPAAFAPDLLTVNNARYEALIKTAGEMGFGRERVISALEYLQDRGESTTDLNKCIDVMEQFGDWQVHGKSVKPTVEPRVITGTKVKAQPAAPIAPVQQVAAPVVEERANGSHARESGKSAKSNAALSAVDNLSRQIIRAGSACTGGTDRIQLWSSWVNQMSSTKTYEDSTRSRFRFQDVFKKSGVTVVVENVLRVPIETDKEAAMLEKLLSFLDGGSEVIKKLVAGLRDIGRKHKNAPPAAVSKVISDGLMSFEKIDANCKGFEDQLSQIENDMDRLRVDGVPDTDLPALLPLFARKQQTLTALHGVLRQGIDVTDTRRALFDELDEKLDVKTFSPEVIERRQLELQNMREHAVAERSAMVTDVEHKKTECEVDLAEKQARIIELEKQRDQINRDLERLNAEVGNLNHALGSSDSDLSSADKFYHMTVSRLSQESKDLAGTREKYTEIIEVAAEVKGFLDGAFDMLRTIVSARNDKFNSLLRDGSAQYLDSAGEHVNRQYTDMILRRDRVRFCKTKIATMEAELKEASALGIVDVARHLEGTLRQLCGVQQEAVNELRAIVENVRDTRDVVETVSRNTGGSLRGEAILGRCADFERELGDVFS